MVAYSYTPRRHCDNSLYFAYMSRAIPILPMLAAAGCVVHVDGERPLSEERRHMLDAYMEDEPIVTAMVLELALRMNTGAMTEHGTPSTTQELADAITHTAQWLRELYTRDAIMEADPSLLATPETIAQYDTEHPSTDRDDRIIVSTQETAWSLATIMHEAAHRSFSHDLTVTEDIVESGAALNAGFADAIIMHKDFAYLMTALFAVPAALARENQEAIDVAQRAREAPEPITAQDAERALRERLHESEGMFAQFGLSVDDVVDAYYESGMAEYLARERTEARREILLAHPSERIEIARKR